MRYSLNAPAGAQLPPVLAERYKTADGAALKVALLFLEQPQADCETVCRVLNMTEAVAQRALNYWVSAGLLVTGTVNCPTWYALHAQCTDPCSCEHDKEE